MTTKKTDAATGWADRLSRTSSAPTPEAPAVAQAPPPGTPRVAKVPATYRFEVEVLELVDRAVADAAQNGRKLSKEAAVAHAIRQTYGHLSN